jgi:hypothetical protein
MTTRKIPLTNPPAMIEQEAGELNQTETERRPRVPRQTKPATASSSIARLAGSGTTVLPLPVSNPWPNCETQNV